MATSQKTGDLELGQKIAQRREELGMTRKQLAEATELSYAYISQIETGYRLPSAKHHVILARVLGMSLDELFGAEEAPPVPVRSQVFAQRAAARAPLADIAENRSDADRVSTRSSSRRLKRSSPCPLRSGWRRCPRLQLRIMQSVAEDQARQRR